jgi:hypothetical protein
VRFVNLDAWVSSVSGGLRLQTLKTPGSHRSAAVYGRASHCSMLAAAHPNRGEGDLRTRVGLSAVLRQATRLLLFAIEPPDDDTQLIVGIEKPTRHPLTGNRLQESATRSLVAAREGLGGRGDHRRTQINDPAEA